MYPEDPQLPLLNTLHGLLLEIEYPGITLTCYTYAKLYFDWS